MLDNKFTELATARYLTGSRQLRIEQIINRVMKFLFLEELSEEEDTPKQHCSFYYRMEVRSDVCLACDLYPGKCCKKLILQVQHSKDSQGTSRK